MAEGDPMRKNTKLKIIVVSILAFTVFILGYFLYSDKPFETMRIDEIDVIKVYATHPDKEVVLNAAEMEHAVSLLQDLKISKPGYTLFPPFGCGGQTVRYTVQKTDGSTVVISNFGNILITIDNINYQADYESAQPISKFANAVLDTGF